MGSPHVNGDASYISEYFVMKFPDVEEVIRCRWKFSDITHNKVTPLYYQSIDLFLKISATARPDNATYHVNSPNHAALTVLHTLIRRVHSKHQSFAQGAEVTTKVILAPRDGYPCRGDIFEMRMRHSEFVHDVISFCTWDRRLTAYSRYGKTSLLPLLLSSPAAIVAKQGLVPDHYKWEKLHNDLGARLSFDWVLPKKPAAYRVALVAGRNLYDSKRGLYRAQGFFEAARALGIAVTVVDEPGHWLEGEEFAHLRDGFIRLDLSLRPELANDLVEAVKGHCLDGLVTFTDEYVSATTQAAEILGLPTEPAAAVIPALQKHEMRKIINNTNIQTLPISKIDQLQDPTVVKKLSLLHYPVITKPSNGSASVGVRKAASISAVHEALHLAEKDGLLKDGMLIEEYVDGPEVDCNFVLCDGKVLFLEVTDDLPSAGDATNAALTDTFFETVNISNSGLPQEEINLIRSSVQNSLLRLGLRWGVFHAEARIKNSAMRYADHQGDGITDLVLKDINRSNGHNQLSGDQPSVFLIEVNIRPPGNGCAWLTLFTYGIDYNALHLLRSVNDHERFEALTKPFHFHPVAARSGLQCEAQYWSAHCLIPVHRDNVYVPLDFVARLINLVPDIFKNITKVELHARPGSTVSLKGGVGLIAYVLLFSRTSRRHALEMYHDVIGAARKVLDT